MKILHKFKKIFILSSMFPIAALVSCGASYTINQYDSEKSNISQKEFDDRLNQIRGGNKKSFTISYVNSLNESKTFVIKKENYLIVEEKIRNFLNVYKNETLTQLDDYEKKTIDSLNGLLIKSKDGISILSKDQINTSNTQALLSERDDINRNSVLENIRNYLNKDLKLDNIFIRFKPKGLLDYFRINNEYGTVDYSVELLKGQKIYKTIEVSYENAYKRKDFENIILNKVVSDLVKDFVVELNNSKPKNPINNNTLKNYYNESVGELKTYIHSIYKDYVLIGDPNSTIIYDFTNKHMITRLYLKNINDNKIIGAPIILDWDFS